MRYEVETGTDTGSLILCDPSALPADFERRFQTATVETLDALSRAGLACWIHAERDGRFLLHTYVDESIPGWLWAHLHSPQSVPELRVPSGRLVFAGSEHRFHESAGIDEPHPPADAGAAIRPGTYAVTVYRARYPEGLLERRFRASVSVWEYGLWISMKVLFPLAIAAWIGLVVINFTTARVPYHRYAAPVLFLIFAVPFAVRWSPAFRAIKRRFTYLEREFPVLVARLAYREPIDRP